MDKLKADFFAKGGSDGEWRDILSEGLAPEDMEEFEVGFSRRMSAMNHAKRVPGVGRVIETCLPVEEQDLMKLLREQELEKLPILWSVNLLVRLWLQGVVLLQF